MNFTSMKIPLKILFLLLPLNDSINKIELAEEWTNEKESKWERKRDAEISCWEKLIHKRKT